MRPLRRANDKGWLCLVAMRCSQAWDFIDKRQIDAYAVSLAILYGTIRITEWAMRFADDAGTRTGIEIAAIIAAVMAPYMALQGAAIKFLFDARRTSFEAK